MKEQNARHNQYLISWHDISSFLTSNSFSKATKLLF